MVGSVGEILLALAMVCVLAAFLKYTFGGDQVGALPSEDGDLGLLETVATLPTREAAEVLAARLAREKVRATVSRGPDGWRLLVFPSDAGDARVVLSVLGE